MFARRKTSSSAGIVSMEIFTQVMIFASIILLLIIRKQKLNTIVLKVSIDRIRIIFKSQQVLNGGKFGNQIGKIWLHN